MKQLLLYSLLLCLGFSAKAQYGGEMTIGARINYIGAGRIVTMDGKVINLGYTLQGIVSPGYFVTNCFALGTNLTYEYMKDDAGHQYTLQASPFIRCYTRHGGLRFFGQLESGYGWGESFLKQGHDGQHRLWVSTLKPGIFVRIKEAMAIEVTVMSLEYKKIYMKDKRSGHRITTDKWRFHWLDVSFGLNFVIGL